MGSFYTVAQYVPDPVADERINFGVIVFGGGRIVSRFTRQWKRLRSFGLEPDIGYVREFVEYVDSANMAQFFEFEDQQRIDEEKLQKIVKEWNGSIRLTAPKASLHDHDILLRRMSMLMLRNVERHDDRNVRTRMFATSMAMAVIRDALSHITVKPDAANSLVHKRVDVSGELDQHVCDIGIQGERLMHGIWTVSFDTGDTRKTDSDVKKAAWAIDDIRKKDSLTDISVFALMPPKGSKSVLAKAADKAADMFDRLGAKFVGESDAARWAKDLAATTATRTGLPLRLV